MRRLARVASVAAAVCVLTLVAAPAAHAVPSVTFKCTPAPVDCSGWYRSNVSIDWIVLPSDATMTGCVDKTFSTDTPGTNEFCRADDGAAEVTVQLKIKVDKTPPVVTGGQPARAADVDGWYNHAVPVTFAGTDLTSGIASCTSTTYGGPDSGSASVAGTCVDKAGNPSAALGYGLKYDATAPAVVAPLPERPANANGWFNQAVRFDIDGSDTTSGIADCPPVTYNGPDSATASFTAGCRDRAGNSANRSFGLKYDGTAPTVTSGEAARGADVNGWYNHAIAVAFDGADQLSGVDRCTAGTYSGPDSPTATLPGTCTDKAGNVSAPLSFGLRYDSTKPVATGGQPARAADSNGWYRRSVAVSFGGNDQTAGIDTCTTATYAGPDTGAASLAGTCKDRAGNVSDPIAYGLKYDATAPLVAGADPDRPANGNGWFNHPVTYSFRGTDATSGVAACPGAAYSGPSAAAASVTGTCRDVAGNSSSRSFPLAYDDSPPTVTKGQAARSPDLGGWYNRPVAVSFDGSDTVSGLDTCSTVNYGGPDNAAALAAGTCTDKAGNVSSPLGYGLKYDATAPTVTGGHPVRAADANGWYNHAVAISFAGTDPVSGVDSCTSTTYDGADSATASVSGTCTDKAGNSSGPFGFGLKYDATDPRVTAGTPQRSPDANGWFNRSVAFDFQGTDATSGIATCPAVTYSGPDSGSAAVVGRCTDRAGNASTGQFGLKYDDTAPAVTLATPDRPPNAAGWYRSPVTVAFGGSDAGSGVDACTKRTYGGPDTDAASVSGTCTDKAGNVSGTDEMALKYDATAPVVTGGQPARAADANGWYNRAVAIAFAGSDAVSHVNACTAANYGGPDTATANVTGTCADKAGNVSDPLGVSFKYDETGPVVTGALPDRQPDHDGWFVSPVRFAFTGTDATSGLASDACPTVSYEGPDGAGETVVGRCRDRAANSTSRGFPIDYDATPPMLNLTAESGDASVSLSWQTSPDASAVEVVRTPGHGGETSSVVFRGPGTSFVDGRVENGGRYSYEVEVSDPAGNTSTQTVVGLPNAPPGGVGAAAVPGVVSVPGSNAIAEPPRKARAVFAPATGSEFLAGHPPRLSWPTVRRAQYYNVQLFRGKRKLLSVWPTHARYQLKKRWTFRGERRRLTPGHYRWMVWPGYGRRAKARYGKPIVRSTFVIKRRGAASATPREGRGVAWRGASIRTGSGP